MLITLIDLLFEIYTDIVYIPGSQHTFYECDSDYINSVWAVSNPIKEGFHANYSN